MKTWRSLTIFNSINSEKFSEQEKVEAIHTVLQMQTHSGMSKKYIINAFRWLFAYREMEFRQIDERRNCGEPNSFEKFTPQKEPMLYKKSWKEFRESGMLWWINMILHTFGWAIAVTIEDDGNISAAYPAKVKFRGFSEKENSEGYIKVGKYLQENAKELLEEAEN